MEKGVSMTHPSFRDVYIELYGDAIYVKGGLDHVKLKFRWMNRAGYSIEKRPTWKKVTKKFVEELVPYDATTGVDC